MVAIAASANVIIGIDPMTAMTMILAMLSQNWGPNGLTWSDPESQLLYGINAATDTVFTFSAVDYAELESHPLSIPFGSVGIEFHPGVGTLYACSNPGDLWAVDPKTGAVTVEKEIGLANCDNLAAPFGPVDCIPQ